jgi:hypothetical protein
MDRKIKKKIPIPLVEVYKLEPYFLRPYFPNNKRKIKK